MVTLPGHHIPETPAQCGAALTNRMGLPVRFASARPRSRVANHWICTPSGTFDSDAGVDAVAGAVPGSCATSDPRVSKAAVSQDKVGRGMAFMIWNSRDSANPAQGRASLAPLGNQTKGNGSATNLPPPFAQRLCSFILMPRRCPECSPADQHGEVRQGHAAPPHGRGQTAMRGFSRPQRGNRCIWGC